MAVLQLNNVDKSYITNSIFTNISFNVNAGQKIGLVGPNGTGKSTLMKCIVGLESIDNGIISFAKDITFGYLDQNAILDLNSNLEEIMLEAFQDIIELHDEIRVLENKISLENNENILKELLDSYQVKQALYEEKNGYAIESRIKGIIIGLGFQEKDLMRLASSFSGGERTRIMLARLLVKNPDLLLLDEPTNHLDLPSIEWLETYLKNYKGAIMVISHDEYFLNSVVDTVYDLENQALTIYSVPFFRYKEEKKKNKAIQHKQYLQQQNKIAKELEYINRNRAGVNSKQARGREKRLSKEVLLKDTVEQHTIKIKNYEVSETARFVLTIDNLDVHVQGKQLAKSLNFNIKSREKVAIIGRNGIGKSTLLKTILKAIESNDDTVRLGNRVNFVYFDQHQSFLNEENTILEQTLSSCDLKISEAKKLLARYLFTEDDLERFIFQLSGGEKVRLSLMILLYTEPNFLIMDEPTNHLDSISKELVISFLDEFSGAILVVSHDRQLLNKVTTRTLEFTSEGITEYLGNYAYYSEKKTLQLLLDNEEKKEKQFSQLKPKKKTTTISRSKLKNEIEKLEQELSVLEKTIEGLNEQLSMADVDYATIAEQLEKNNQALDIKLEQWQEKSEILEEITESE